MRKFYYGLFSIFILGACDQEGHLESREVETTQIENIEIPGNIFESEKVNNSITEEEIKLSIKNYLDSSGDLYDARYYFEEILDSGKELNKSDSEKLKEIDILLKENDENFSTYILNNTLPGDYQYESERISNYITALNQYLNELDNMIDNLTEGDLSKENLKSLGNIPDIVNGKEQKKIEKFLEDKEIYTNVFKQ
ncbi:NDxxF motif lipoprotein [Cytobacillus purgationiresistens]|uniref:NDxxF motif lipoprotein n=1 Tax=Cytobacillus purgationiresistens TaxID=863449 RepID=A0ABU0AR64_9BACI|nr:NDxxF motif lipoprotein [Cytobacillus purgationiresistens]MDQ0273698.1 hypothetical protein [Cytobacillus purgationiresistens]